MNRFLIAALLLLLVALSMVVGAFLYVQFLLVKEAPTSADPNTVTGVDEVPVAPTGAIRENQRDDKTASEVTPISNTTSDVPDTSIPLSSLPLSDTQKSLLATAGIDYETFIITPEMVTCAQQKLGADRFRAIVAGSSPSALETMSLLGCL